MNRKTMTFQDAVDKINQDVSPEYHLHIMEASITDGIPTYWFRAFSVDHTPIDIKFHSRTDAGVFLNMFAIAKLAGADSMVTTKRNFLGGLFS